MSKIEKESQTERETDGWLDRETKTQTEWLIYPSEKKNTLIK